MCRRLELYLCKNSAEDVVFCFFLTEQSSSLHKIEQSMGVSSISIFFTTDNQPRGDLNLREAGTLVNFPAFQLFPSVSPL